MPADFAAAAAPVELSPPAAETTTERLTFHGSTSEYFGIWFVNMLLTVMTLGIYSPWAKVRRLRYFYGNTSFHDARFDFDASPLAILFSRLLVMGFVGLGFAWAGEDVIKNAHYSLVLLILLPWALVRGLAFNARYSSFSNLRFGFNKTNAVYLRMYFLLLPLLSFLLLPYFSLYMFNVTWLWALILTVAATALVASPWLLRAYHSTKASNYRWGNNALAFQAAPIRDYLLPCWLCPLSAVAVVYVSVSLAHVVYELYAKLFAEILGFPEFLVISFIVPLVLLLIFFLMMIRVLLFRLFWNGIILPAGGRIRCRFNNYRFAFAILLVNYVAMVVSLGLLIPWATVRKTRFLTENMEITLPVGALENMLADAEKKQSAVGAELDALEGFDFDIGIM